MLMIIGLLVSASFLLIRDARTEAAQERIAAESADRQIESLLAQQEILLERQQRMENEQKARDDVAVQERAELAARAASLERFILLLLARSHDPRVRQAATESGSGSGGGSGASPRPSASPTPTSGSGSLTPRPTPSPTPSSSPNPPNRPELVCVVLPSGQRVCIPRPTTTI